MRTPQTHTFTTHFTGIAGQLINQVGISTVFDPTTPPDPKPKMLTTNALWDTGATHTGISNRLATSIGLVSVSPGIVTHAGGSDKCNRYIVNLVLPNKILVAGVYVSEVKLDNHFDLLIGMDIITQGDMSLTHVGGTTVFSFRIPSIETVDFVKRQNALAFAGVRVNDNCPCGSGKKFKKCHQLMTL